MRYAQNLVLESKRSPAIKHMPVVEFPNALILSKMIPDIFNPLLETQQKITRVLQERIICDCAWYQRDRDDRSFVNINKRPVQYVDTDSKKKAELAR